MPAIWHRSRVSRRTFLQGAAGAGSAALLGAPAVARAAQAEELRILFPGGTWKDWFDQTFVSPFATAHGTQIVWKTGMAFEPLVLAQRRRPEWDLIHENQNTSSQLGALDAVIEWKQDRIPNIPRIHPAFRYKYLVGKVHTPYGIVWNNKRITRPITSWWDLWDPAFAGKVAFPDWVWVGEDVFYAINAVAGGTGGEYRSRHRQDERAVPQEQGTDHQECGANAAGPGFGRRLDLSPVRRTRGEGEAGRRPGQTSCCRRKAG